MKDFPYMKCLNPKRLLNRYTGEVVLVECNQCEHCKMKASVAKTTRCKLESAFHRYTYFVTLTFENKHLPCARLILRDDIVNQLNPDEETYDVVRESDGFICGQVTFPSNIHKHALLKKCKAGINRVPICDMYIVQKFIKRLRKRITNEKIRIFSCSEYGPVHFRPHFHLLVWFDQDQTLSSIGQAILESWTFGRVDSSLASGKASSYVASYVNGFNTLPKVFKLASTSPKSNHSWYLGEQFLKGTLEAIQEDDYRRINNQRICVNGFNSDILLWRSFKTRLFPKFKGYASLSEHERVLSYSAYAILRDWTQETCPIRLARFVADYVELYDFYHPNEQICDLLQLFRHGLNYYERDSYGNIVYLRPSLVDFRQFEKQIYSYILKSRYFLTTICENNMTYGHVRKMLNWIDGYYKYMDAENLKNQLKIQETMTRKDKDTDVSLFYHNTSLYIDKLKKNRLYMRHKVEVLNLSKNFIKHKELNDINLYFNY